MQTPAAAREPNAAQGRVALPLLLTFLFASIATFQASTKLLWGDEFVTYWIGQQQSFGGIWRALVSGADPNPPLMHVLNWASTSLFGSGSLAVRLPSVLAMGLALTSLWFLLRRFFAPVYAAAGCLALMTTRGFDYTYDARSYALLLGFALAALTVWMQATTATGAKRFCWLLALALALAAGLSSNYYGVLAFVPVGAGEAALALQTRRWRPGVWVVLGIAALPLFAFLPLIRANLNEFGPHAWNKPQASMISESYFILVEGILWPVLALAIASFVRSRRRPADGESGFVPAVFPTEARIAVAVFLAFPFLGFAMAFTQGAMISPRCVIPVCGGFAIATAVLSAQLFSRRSMVWVLVFLTVWVSARQAACAYVLRQQRHAFFRLRDNVETSAAPGERVLVGDSLALMPLFWYGSPTLRQQIVFPVDFSAIHRYEPDDSGEQNLWGGRHGVFPVPIDNPASLVPGHAESLLIGRPEGWLARTLLAQGFSLAPARVSTNPNGSHAGDDLGGIFTPLAHPSTGIYFVSPASTSSPSPAVSSNP